jgi:hypothetical protein
VTRLSHEDLRDMLDHLVESGLVESYPDFTAPVASLSDGMRRQEACSDLTSYVLLTLLCQPLLCGEFKVLEDVPTRCTPGWV